eukprot:CAMPEP_0184330026 /NCGR_PEP_ID=MMETSP1049-20130417/144462_1 /TAXON_ID=77928 /ORGANISM="Proteomonas sulcata, Strain CCMP704" /LENGTH=89 /DNA_ID=CAMNT_0026652431 /DNA_START=531 /DNA_END=800 /DNA_ORIENTATION=+
MTNANRSPLNLLSSLVPKVLAGTLPTSCCLAEAKFATQNPCDMVRRPSDAGAECLGFGMDLQPLSPRPHQRPSGYKVWYQLGLGQDKTD